MKIVKKIIHGVGWRVHKGIGIILKFLSYRIIYPAIYNKENKKPIEQKAVFLERRDAEISDNFRLLYDALQKKGNLKLVFLSLGEGRLGYLSKWKNNAVFLKEMATAKYVFINDSSMIVSCVKLRPETKVVQVWHACGAFKKFGYSTTDKLFGSNTKELEKYPLHKNFSLVTVSSPDVAWAYAEAFHMEDYKEQIVPTGVSRTDVFFDQEKIREAGEKLRALVPQSVNKKAILYAPTFRGHVKEAYSPDEMDLVKMKESLGEKYILLTKHHPFVQERPKIPKEAKDFVFDVTDNMSIEELLMVSDLCISDYSSLIFEYSLFEKPMLFFAYDLDDYFDWRGFYYNYDEMTPGPICKTTEELIDSICKMETDFDKKQVLKFKEKFMSSCDGHATERILNYVLE